MPDEATALCSNLVTPGSAPKSDTGPRPTDDGGAQQANPLSARLLLFFCRHHIPVIGTLYRILLNCDVYCDCSGRTVFMPHPYGIVIHSMTHLGDRVTVMQQVTLGGSRPGVN